MKTTLLIKKGIEMKFKAFTITEAIVCFLIIGLVFIATLTNISRNDHYDKLYWQAFNTLYQASKSAALKFDNEYNYQESWANNEKNESSRERANIKIIEGTPNISRSYPGFLRTKENNNPDVDFCKMLTNNINTLKLSNEEECTYFDLTPNYIIKNTRGKVGINFYEGFSSKNYDKEDYDSGNQLRPTFRALNGMKFFMSSVLTANFIPPGESAAFKIEERESFRLVVVDLNGDAKPNSQFIKGGKYPDLVLFAINWEGDVIPLGLPEWSKKYISAIVYYPNDVNEKGEPLYPKSHSQAETLWHAKKIAWGRSDCDATNAPYLQNITQWEALSQSTKFYLNAIRCRDGSISGCANKESQDIFVDEVYSYLVTQFLYKEEGSEEFYKYLTEDECNESTQVDKANGCISANNINTEPTCSIDFKH